MARCPKCKYTALDDELLGESGVDHLIDGCPSCGYKPEPEVLEEDLRCSWCGEGFEDGGVWRDATGTYHYDCIFEAVERERKQEEEVRSD